MATTVRPRRARGALLLRSDYDQAHVISRFSKSVVADVMGIVRQSKWTPLFPALMPPAIDPNEEIVRALRALNSDNPQEQLIAAHDMEVTVGSVAARLRWDRERLTRQVEARGLTADQILRRNAQLADAIGRAELQRAVLNSIGCANRAVACTKGWWGTRVAVSNLDALTRYAAAAGLNQRALIDRLAQYVREAPMPDEYRAPPTPEKPLVYVGPRRKIPKDIKRHTPPTADDDIPWRWEFKGGAGIPTPERDPAHEKTTEELEAEREAFVQKLVASVRDD